MIYQGMARYPVSEVVLHCAAIKTGQFKHMKPIQIFATINKWHIDRGFRCFGYHGLIMPDGEWYSGRPFDQIGAHVKGHNRGTLGFLLIESQEVTHIGEFSDWFTDAQRDTLRRMIPSIDGISKVSGHNDYAPKLCPGFQVVANDWL